MPKHFAAYLRVSSRNQDTKSQDPDLKRWAAAQDKPVRWYRDVFTGKTMDRPGWKKLEADIAAGKVAAVVVWRLDRLGRTAKGLTALFEELRSRRVGLVSLKEGLDLSTPAGRLMAHVLASVAEYETELRGERVQAGQAVARENGKRWGGSKKGRRVKVSPLQASTIRKLKAEGESVAAIARTVGLSRPTCYSVLKEGAEARSRSMRGHDSDEGNPEIGVAGENM
ncbi:MAG: recombinase family protein [Planctomycetes bacterium]|nr:recombinase family protein [Planctomycetota bacterium]